MFDAIRMLGNTYNYDVNESNIYKVIKSSNSESLENYHFALMLTAYGTFLLAFVVITIALNNILIGLSVNIAKEGIENAMYQRMNAMARNIYGIEIAKVTLKRWFGWCSPW